MQRVVGLQLEQFRTYTQYVLRLDPQVTLITGANASGKTTIIEALYLAATGESFRASKVEEMIAFTAELGRVKVKVAKQLGGGQQDIEQTDLEVTVTRGVVQGKSTSKRLYSINGVRRRRASLLGNVYAVVFRPEDMRLVEGSPARRRDYLDRCLAMLFPEYDQAATQYQQVLIRYNKFLQAVREHEQPQSVLHYWEQLLVNSGKVLTDHRQAFITAINQVPFVKKLRCVYLSSPISTERLNEYRPRAIAAGHTLIGPHKDDLQIMFFPTNKSDQQEEKDIALFGSRGQQRLAVLWLKLSELSYIEQIKQQTPLLLLDDIFSELDLDNGQIISDIIENHQSVVTTAHPESLPAFTDNTVTRIQLD